MIVNLVSQLASTSALTHASYKKCLCLARPKSIDQSQIARRRSINNSNKDNNITKYD